MSDPSRSLKAGGPSARLRLAVLAVILIATGRAAAADLEPRVAAGKCQSEPGTLLTQEAPGETWEVATAGEQLHSRDRLLALPGLQAVVEPRSDAVRVTLWGNLPQLSSFPGLESAVVLHDSRAFDLDLSLLRGRVVLANRKSEGAARVWVRVLDGGSELLLEEPGSEVALEVYGRWPRGVPFAREAVPQHRPAGVLGVLALKGRSVLRVGGMGHHLSPPPGNAIFHWDSVAGPEEAAQRLDRLPAWADAAAEPAAASEWAGLLKEVREAVARKGPVAALGDLLAHADSRGERGRHQQEVAVLGLGALGDITRVVGALEDSRHAAARAAAVIALRHWIGEAAGHDQRLYHVLTDALGYSQKQAEAVMQLLHSPFDPGQPETYEALIAYLGHKRLAVRELAYWHLQRMVPADEVVPFDAAAPEEERARSIAAWRKLLADGKLPPRR
jgi:hypothetical protein